MVLQCKTRMRSKTERKRTGGGGGVEEAERVKEETERNNRLHEGIDSLSIRRLETHEYEHILFAHFLGTNRHKNTKTGERVAYRRSILSLSLSLAFKTAVPLRQEGKHPPIIRMRKQESKTPTKSKRLRNRETRTRPKRSLPYRACGRHGPVI